MRINFYIILVYMSSFSRGLFYESGFEFLLIKKIDIGLESFSHINFEILGILKGFLRVVNQVIEIFIIFLSEN